MDPIERRTSGEGPGEDAGLILAAQGGDQAAFGRIVRRYQRAIHGLAYGLTRNPSDADDLAQETFVRAWGAIGRFRVGEPLHPWLSRITVNLAFSLFRRRKRRPEDPIEPMLEAGRQFGADDDPAEHAATRERDARLGAAFEELSSEHQAVLVLRAVEDMSYHQIAEVLGVPEGTVMSRLSRARAELKARLAARTGESR
jgi:RNA polymerase sigma-70 factor (ECF subfamily)